MQLSIPFAVLTLLWASAAATALGPDFNREVRPILSQHCFKCHGPDDGQRQAGLRLDQRAFATAKLPDGDRAVVPGHIEKSELVKRIFATGPLIMPPASANKPLSAREREILRRWVASGAVYRPHWAFVAPKQAAIPAVKHKGWLRNPIDAFVLARMEHAGLSPSAQADRYTLARRAYIDLIGLPPTVEETAAFVNDPRPDAYERMIDRLLASPHYGERWARRWLDLARYADTNGYEKDRPRQMWIYRNWVIDALNRDMPFTEFTIDQIAGDLLPNATRDQRIATGFHRNSMLNEEGGIDPQEYHFYSRIDRVNTTGTAWLGLTVGCAQCHTHKFDPITQRDYYRTMAILTNTDDVNMEVPSPDVAAKRKQISDRIAAMEGKTLDRLRAPQSADGQQFAVWQRQQEARAVDWRVLRPVKVASSLPLLSIQDDNSVFVSGDEGKRDIYDLDFEAGGAPITAVRLEALPDDRLPAHGPGRVFYEGAPGDFFLSEITLTSGGAARPFATAAAGGGDALQAIDGDDQTGWSINGRQGETTVAVFKLKTPLTADRFSIRMLFERYYASDLGRFRISVTSDPRAGPADLPADAEAATRIPAGRRTAAETTVLERAYLELAPQFKPEREAIAALRKQMPAFNTALVLVERPANNPRNTYLHHRGEYLQRREAVTPGVLSALPPLPAGVPANRLSFARWLVSPANPLTARVTVNRQWAALFGKGIVPTLQDFGYQGEPPSNPELLDWLAVEFMRRGWSLKAIDRLIVTSATYRQSSRVTPEQMAKDPDNRLLSHAPRVRMEAEMVRDSALTACGLLSRKIGGPSVYPPQIPGITTEGAYGAFEWKVSAGEDRYRRGLYTFAKRSAPYAMFLTFDAPSGEVCLARRDVSDTPLQALTLLNDQVLVEAAQALGSRIAALPGSDADRIDRMFRRCLTRPPRADETAMMQRFVKEQRARFDRKELDAAAIAGPGPGDLISRAVWTTLARTLLNTDECITIN
jgi:hypothetical protein